MASASAQHCSCADGLWNGSRPDGHAPIGVMGDHTHGTGEWMFSYRFMTMGMNGFYDGDSIIPEVGSGYMATPTEMRMDMHMFGVMYAPSDKLTLMAMTNYINNSMDMLLTMGPMAGATSKMESNGWGDTSVGGLYKIFDQDNQRAHVGFSLSLPTGSTGETFTTPMGMPAHQPFPMQLGTGTFDLKPSITYLSQPSLNWSWGAQASARFHLGRNDQGYSFGDSVSATTWIARNLNARSAISFRLDSKVWGGIDGDTDFSANRMSPTMSSPADPNNHGGSRIEALIGYNYYTKSGARFAIEAGKTIYQKLDGPQLGNDWSVNAGFQYAF